MYGKIQRMLALVNELLANEAALTGCDELGSGDKIRSLTGTEVTAMRTVWYLNELLDSDEGEQ